MRDRFPMAAFVVALVAGIVSLAALSGGGRAAPTGSLLLAGMRLADRSPSAVPVDVELVLAVDVSYSMDPDEQALQREGYITGITSSGIHAGAAAGRATAASPSPISNGPVRSTRRSSCRGG